MTDGWDDDDVLAALQAALARREAVPPELVTAAKNAFAWHDIDAELAQLTYDSTGGLQRAAATRAEGASIRALTFTSARLTIELEVSGDSVLGQVVPAQAAMIAVQTSAGTDTVVPTDEIGCFSLHPIPAGPFRLHCQASGGVDVLTGWITL